MLFDLRVEISMVALLLKSVLICSNFYQCSIGYFFFFSNYKVYRDLYCCYHGVTMICTGESAGFNLHLELERMLYVYF